MQRIPHTGHLRTADPIPTHRQTESVGSHRRRGSWQKWLQKCGLYPTGSLQGPPGHTQGSREKATSDPAEGEGRRQRAVQGARRARKRQMESLTMELHCTHVGTHTLLEQLRQPSAKQCQPHPSGRRGRPRRTHGGAGTAPRPQSHLFGLRSGTACLPKANFKGSTFYADKWIPDSTSTTCFKRITQLVLFKNPNYSQTKTQQIQPQRSVYWN